MDYSRRELFFRTSTTLAAIAGVPMGLSAREAPGEVARQTDIHIELHAVLGRVPVRPGTPTRVWHYQGRLLRGDAAVLDVSAGGYLGPIIRVRQGQRVRIDLVNGLQESTIIHWHGLHVPADMDGHPRFAIAPGQRYVYEFTVRNRAGSYWFHPHPHGRTGRQVYAGLAGLFIVSDDEEAAIGLPSGPQDMPLVIQDRNFDNDNQFVYMGGGASAGVMGGGMGSMMAGMMGVLGSQILINGGVQGLREVERRPHRLRLLNAANTRTLKLAWSDGSPVTVIGSDGGLLAKPVQREYVMLAPAERIDLWVDFGRWQTGSEVALRSLAFDGGVAMGGMMGGQNALPDGAAFELQRFKIGAGQAHTGALPGLLTQIAPPEPSLAVNFERPKVFDLTMGMMVWGINGKRFDMLGASELETVKLGTHEIWEFRNEGRGSMMTMPHSMHVHGLPFRVLSRSISRRNADDYDTVSAGFVDEGWKDTVLVMPGERVRVLLHFTDYEGLFLYHCHMLEHEDSGLMRNYLVKA